MARPIEAKFHALRQRGRKAFIPFITAGDPDLDTTVRLVAELARCGSDIVELGIPFSDPIADGPVIQRSSERALRHGYGMADYLKAVERIRRETDVPILLFSYYNPIFQYGLEGLARDARSAGADGVLVTDMTPEESEEYRDCLERHGLDAVFLAAPTSDAERIRKIAGCSRGFVYLVSRTGVTGVQESVSESVVPTLRRIRAHTTLPVAVGFGVSRPEHVRAVWEFADGAVVGSALVACVEKCRTSAEALSQVGDLSLWLTGRRSSAAPQRSEPRS
ncbi:MAG: tryptophan synthase subunit alpha [Acidobacteria bacterium]|nr:tryptophan synthase subunit alpha [Acidobacteriota bacterium]